MSQTDDRQENRSRQGESAPSLPILRAEELFQGNREICIEHDGKYYRLRITRRNKLILQK